MGSRNSRANQLNTYGAGPRPVVATGPYGGPIPQYGAPLGTFAAPAWNNASQSQFGPKPWLGNSAINAPVGQFYGAPLINTVQPGFAAPMISTVPIQ